MAIKTVPLADRMHSAVSQICLTEPEKLLTDGRIIPIFSRLTSLCTGGRCAWELLLQSVAAPDGTALEARLITHISVPASQRTSLVEAAARTQASLLAALAESNVVAAETEAPIPPLRTPTLITLGRQGSGLLPQEATLAPGLLRQRLCTRPGNGLSLLLVQSGWAEGELQRCCAGLDAEHQAMLARDPVFDAVTTLWGPDAHANAAWLQELMLGRLCPTPPVNPLSYPACLRNDPWRLLTLLPASPPRTTLLTLSELLTICGCPAGPGEMQRMCRTGWRSGAAEALREANVALLPMDMPLQENDLRYLGLQQDSDLEGVLHMDAQMCDMLRMCVAILRKLGVLGAGAPPEATDRQTAMTGLLLPTVGHIYEQFVRECCYQTMHCPYYTYTTGRRPQQVVRVPLSAYDLGPGPKDYHLRPLPPDASDAALQNIIREQMIDDFTACATIDGRRCTDDFWYGLFNDMTTARSQRNGLTHERASLRQANSFARAFLLDRPGSPSLLRRLLMCRRVATNFPDTC